MTRNKNSVMTVSAVFTAALLLSSCASSKYVAPPAITIPKGAEVYLKVEPSPEIVMTTVTPFVTLGWLLNLQMESEKERSSSLNDSVKDQSPIAELSDTFANNIIRYAGMSGLAIHPLPENPVTVPAGAIVIKLSQFHVSYRAATYVHAYRPSAMTVADASNDVSSDASRPKMLRSFLFAEPDNKYAYALHEDITANIDQSLEGLRRASDGLAQVVAKALVAGVQ